MTPTTPVTVEVTQEDIDAGESGSYFFCPIARAVERLLAKQTSAGVCAKRIDVRGTRNGKFEKTRHSLPDVAAEFVQRFDEEKVVEPFTFTLDLPTACLALAANKEETTL